MKIRFKKTLENIQLPERNSEHAAGFDIYYSGEQLALKAGQVYTMDLGFASEIPAGHAALILPRSSVGVKHGLHLLNTTGLIDSDYRGSWKAVFRTQTDMVLNKGDRFLQFIIIKLANVEIVEADELTETKRNGGGFGSTDNQEKEIK